MRELYSEKELTNELIIYCCKICQQFYCFTPNNTFPDKPKNVDFCKQKLMTNSFHHFVCI